MPIPLLDYPSLSQNSRVTGFEGPADNQPKIYTTDELPSGFEMEMLIMAAYRQIVNEQQMLDRYRQRVLESQLKAGQITVKDFIRGLILSDNFRRLVYDCNNNYRFVQICIQRLLGRDVYDEREKLAWSVVLATKGLKGFIDALLDSDEYNDNFGEDTVPYQRRRKLRHRGEGDVTFEHTARYGADYRDNLPRPAYGRSKYNTFEGFELTPDNKKALLVFGGVLGSLIALWIIAILFI